ncbi:F/Y rich C-terminus-domain-containing protein [Gaertneriomyces semiglobifer]|nr:F/Y rich C-terminus-domain-containing protein [Gaertneriomyces semiglobifer]
MFHGFDIPQIEVHAHHQHGAGSPIPRPATPSGASNNETVKKSRKAQHPPSRRVANIHKLRKVQHVPLDESGKPILPVTIGIITVHQLGTVVWDRKGYYNDRYIFPVGYTSTRSYASMIHLGQTTNYTCSVGEGPDGPRFYVTPADAPDRVAEGSTPTGAWTVIVKAVNALRGKEQTSTVSGPDYFGFSHPTISKLIQDLPDVDKCEGYIWQQFEEIRGRGTKRVRSGSAAPVLPSASPLATASVTSSPKRKVPTELLELPPDWGELGHSSGPSGYLEPAGYSRGQSPESDSMVSEEDESDDE